MTRKAVARQGPLPFRPKVSVFTLFFVYTSQIARVLRAGFNDYLEGATLAPRWRAARTRGPVGELPA